LVRVKCPPFSKVIINISARGKTINMKRKIHITTILIKTAGSLVVLFRLFFI